MKIINTQRAITPKVDTRVVVHVFCMSTYGVNICVKIYENMSSGFKVMKRTQELLAHKGQ